MDSIFIYDFLANLIWNSSVMTFLVDYGTVALWMNHLFDFKTISISFKACQRLLIIVSKLFILCWKKSWVLLKHCSFFIHSLPRVCWVLELWHHWCALELAYLSPIFWPFDLQKCRSPCSDIIISFLSGSSSLQLNSISFFDVL